MGTCYGESARTSQVIDKACREDHKWSSKKMEGEEGLNLNTVECLRGRLLAERHASRVAKEEADSLGTKLVELERMLREEIKLREKAERKLKFLRKKLESFNMSRQLEHSDSSVITENSCGSSSGSSISKHSSEANETKNHAKNAKDYHNIPSTTKDCDSHVTDNSRCNSEPVCFLTKILMKNQNLSYEDLKNDESRVSSICSKSSVTDNEDDGKGNFFDNSLALVPVNVTTTSHATSNSKPVDDEALDALKHAGEGLQSSMGTM